MQARCARSPLKSKNPLRELFPALGTRTHLVGIVNCTPDSFSDGGVFEQPQRARARAIELVQSGADALDFGAESTRPGAKPVSSHEQWQRLEPILDGLGEEMQRLCSKRIPISIDTRSAEVAARAVAAGATWINDVSAGAFDPDMLSFIAERGVPYVAMHMRGTPETMQSQVSYAGDFFDTLRREILERLETAFVCGVMPEQIVVDPGMGFAKTAEQCQWILENLPAVQSLGYPVYLGISRKSFLRKDAPAEPSTLADLDLLTLSAAQRALKAKVDFLRVHNVAMLQAMP